MKKQLFFLLIVACITSVNAQKLAFFGAEADVASLADDDAKAAATWMETSYGSNFKYIPFSDISTANLSDVSVAVLYYLTSKEGTYSASPTDVSTMLPAELQVGTAQTNALTDWVKAGGNMMIAGDPTPFIFNMGRVPADFTADPQRVAGNYVYSEFGNAGLETGKPADDIWGLGMRDANNSGDRRGHPFFNGLTFTDNEYLSLNNAPDREVRLIWWQHFDGILNPSCCGQDAAVLFEETMSATKMGTLRHVGDSFGYGAVLYNPTDGTNNGNFDSNIPTTFKGSIFSIENTIIGYEWDANGGTNDFQANIEKLTANVIAHFSDNTIVLSVNEVEKFDFSLYPNPVKNTFYIKSNTNQNLKIDLYSITGKLIYKNLKLENQGIDVSNLNSGIYFTSIKNENNKSLKTIKIIKQ
ncbi:T9SS type A sorting domain-containing protein [Polaribacter sp.]|uniref:T9SS type A sorting domain-containing protein n=1 Tax=Polaribacter sp. TaxID=1920175 RepID=UPI003F69D1C6